MDYSHVAEPEREISGRVAGLVSGETAPTPALPRSAGEGVFILPPCNGGTGGEVGATQHSTSRPFGRKTYP